MIPSPHAHLDDSFLPEGHANIAYMSLTRPDALSEQG